MSLILEALRKSEAERRRDSAPDVALELPPAPVRGARATPAWLWPVLAAVVALAVLGGWWGAKKTARDSAPSASVPAPAMPPAPADAGLPRIVPHAEPSTATEQQLPEAPQAVVASDATPPQPATAPAPVRSPPATAPASPAMPPASAPDIAATGLPPVKLSMHMWDADPTRRFVILDGQRMGEGDRSGGLSVVAIDRTGVVVERDGQRAHIALP